MRKYLAALAAFVAVAVLVGTSFYLGQQIVPPIHRTVVSPSETIYIQNLAPGYISDRQIRTDIPAWEQAANKLFAPEWRTPLVHLVLMARGQSAPAGAIVATFKQKGPIQGALAFHFEQKLVPQIVVYAGTDNYYGYSNSVSFTHELFELMADHFVSYFNIGYATPYFYVGQVAMPMPRFAPWFNEACDPVEKYFFRLHGVAISDFITPNWFNDPVQKGQYDYMGLVQFPYQVLKGGYAQFIINGQDMVVQNFRHAGPDANGYLKAEDAAAKALH